MCLSRYRNPYSKRKMKKKAKLKAKQEKLKNDALIGYVPDCIKGVKFAQTPDEFMAEYLRAKRSRKEPDDYQKEKPLSDKVYSASGGNKTYYSSKSPTGKTECALAHPV